jgi:hypothetical protein
LAVFLRELPCGFLVNDFSEIANVAKKIGKKLSWEAHTRQPHQILRNIFIFS